MSSRGYALAAVAVVAAFGGWVVIVGAVRREIDAHRLRRRLGPYRID